MHVLPPAESVYLDLSDRAKLRLAGADRVRFLNGQVSNDVRLASAERSIYTGVMTIKGKLCADAFVHAGDDFLLMDAEPGLAETLLPRLERYMIADDVVIEDVTEALRLLHLIDFTERDRLANIRATLGPKVRLVESLRYGRPGLDIFAPREAEVAIRHQVHSEFIELNGDAAEAWRILAGVPRWGAELDADTMPAEAGIEERSVSFTKGCYIGQEIVSRVKSVGRVNRQLRGLRATDSSPLFAGMILRDPAAPDREVGRVTSAAPAAGHGGAEFVALGYVRRGLDEPGTILDATAQDLEVTPPPCRVEVCSLPFV